MRHVPQTRSEGAWGFPFEKRLAADPTWGYGWGCLAAWGEAGGRHWLSVAGSVSPVWFAPGSSQAGGSSRRRRYNRAKKCTGAQEGNDNAAENKVEKITTLKTSERLAKEHGVTEKTVRNAGKFQAAAEKLGLEKEIAAGLAGSCPAVAFAGPDAR
jgi:hypothetical protein